MPYISFLTLYELQKSILQNIKSEEKNITVNIKNNLDKIWINEEVKMRNKFYHELITYDKIKSINKVYFLISLKIENFFNKFYKKLSKCQHLKLMLDSYTPFFHLIKIKNYIDLDYRNSDFNIIFSDYKTIAPREEVSSIWDLLGEFINENEMEKLEKRKIFLDESKRPLKGKTIVFYLKTILLITNKLEIDFDLTIELVFIHECFHAARNPYVKHDKIALWPIEENIVQLETLKYIKILQNTKEYKKYKEIIFKLNEQQPNCYKISHLKKYI